MYRLGELSDGRRKAIGWPLLLFGLVLLVISVLWIHYTSIPPEEDGGIFDWVPRSVAGSYSVLWKGSGYLTVFAASQFMLVGALFVWVLNQKMTWARATFAAFLTWIELVIIFGIVPSEWLNFAQTELDWSAQRVALTVPPFLVLGNDVDISYAMVKDSISMGWHIFTLGAGAILAIQIQKIKEGRPPSAEKPEPKSPYGRPLVPGDT
jgi:hypothetical protein